MFAIENFLSYKLSLLFKKPILLMALSQNLIRPKNIQLMQKAKKNFSDIK